MKKIYVDEESACELRRIRKIIAVIIGLLEEKIDALKNGDNMPENKEDMVSLLLGKNENVLSALCKLGNMMIKLNGFALEGTAEDNFSFEEVDLNIMRDYLETTVKRGLELCNSSACSPESPDRFDKNSSG
ncbi:MAG: hypothetical protein LBI70_02075 [Rickettsiales bacterium]|jgi:hypothetical protein|nr:hypothetical protein [Rickettsiales bacterium]